MDTKMFCEKMLEFLPSTLQEYEESIEYYGELLATIVIEDIFMKEVVRLLTDNEDKILLAQLFDFLEYTIENANQQCKSNLKVTVMEILGNDKDILALAHTYMGEKSYNLQIEADRGLGRIK